MRDCFRLAARISILPALLVAAAALPEIAFPFNSQVPTVARVAKPYSFQIAEATFTQDADQSIKYTLLDAPAWLSIDSQTRTLYGTPDQGNSGPNTFTIVADDSVGSVSMDCILVVTTSTPPRITGNMSAILANSGTLSGPTSLTLRPSDAFTVSFGKSFFQAGTGQVRAYYATLYDHTPLPSWLKFQQSSLGFLGVTPTLVAEPQSWTVNLIASDVVGFAGVVATFTLTISANQLTFTPQREDLVTTANVRLSYTTLLDDLFLNGGPMSRSQIRSAFMQGPSWLSLKNDTLYLEGTPPVDFKPQDVAIVVTDTYGDLATKTVHLHGKNDSLFAGEIRSLTATAGKLFTYTIEQALFSQPNLNTTVDLDAASSWLHYDPDTLMLQGIPPLDTKSQTVEMTITASSMATSTKESQTFGLEIQAATLGDAPTASASTTASGTTTESRSMSTSTATPLGAPIVNATSNHRSVKAGVAVGIVIGCLAFAALVCAVAMLLCRHKRRPGSRTGGRPIISKPKPIGPDDPLHSNWPIYEASKESHDLESGPAAHDDPPPQLDLPLLPPSPMRLSRMGGYRRSLASSMAEGEAATIEADPNIPVWGRKSANIHTPHDSYSAATELARHNTRTSQNRLSQFGRLSPKERASRILYSWHSHHSKGLEPDSNNATLQPADRRSRINSGLSVTRERSSVGPFNTHGTSLLSARASDFPQPPAITKRKSRNIPMLSFYDADNRRSIRLVNRSNSTMTDDRPLAEKRQSFIRNRASSSIVSPLFASSRRSSNLREDSLAHSSSLRRDRSQRTVFSASSSLDPHHFQNPPLRNPLRLQSTLQNFTPSFPRGTHATTGFPSRGSSPTRGSILEEGEHGATSNITTVPENPARHLNYHSAAGSFSSSTTNHFKDALQAEAEAHIAAQFALSRDERNWVLPGEASPTPPPSSRTTRNREAVRRKWANKLKRDNKGEPVSRDVSPVRLTDVAQKLGQKRREKLEMEKTGTSEGVYVEGPGQGNGQGGGGGGQDRLSALVSKDSVNGALRTRARMENGRAATATESEIKNHDTQMAAGASDDGSSDWEDMTSTQTSRVGSIISAGDGGRFEGFEPAGTRNASKSSFSTKAFI